MLSSYAVWYFMRASGIVALLLLTLVVALGIATTNRWRLGTLPRSVTAGVHRNASLLAVLFLSIHVLTAVADPYAAVPLSALVPFVSAWSSFWLGLGAAALDLVAALVATSLLRRHLSRRAWRNVHWLAYAAWPFALLHGFGLGSDTSTVWMAGVNLLCLGAVGSAVVWRLLAAEERGAVAARS